VRNYRKLFWRRIRTPGFSFSVPKGIIIGGTELEKMGRNSEVLTLYKNLLRASQGFTSYNFRNYFLRRTRDYFKENKALVDIEVIEAKMLEGQKNLDLLKRQATIGAMYQTHKLVIERNP